MDIFLLAVAAAGFFGLCCIAWIAFIGEQLVDLSVVEYGCVFRNGILALPDMADIIGRQASFVSGVVCCADDNTGCKLFLDMDRVSETALILE